MTISNKMTNNIICITNIIFGHAFLDSFLLLNDIKTRVDHETGQLPKNFWEDIADAMNITSNDNDNTPLQVVLPEEDEHYKEIKLINLPDFDIMTSTVIQKKVNQFLKVRKEMQKT